MLAVCLHWPGEVAPPPGVCPCARLETWRLPAGRMLARTWQRSLLGPDDIEFRSELESAEWTGVWSPRVSQSPLTTSFTINTDQEWGVGHRTDVTSVDGCGHTLQEGGFWVGLCDT